MFERIKKKKRKTKTYMKGTYKEPRGDTLINRKKERTPNILGYFSKQWNRKGQYKNRGDFQNNRGGGNKKIKRLNIKIDTGTCNVDALKTNNESQYSLPKDKQ